MISMNINKLLPKQTSLELEFILKCEVSVAFDIESKIFEVIMC